MVSREWFYIQYEHDKGSSEQYFVDSWQTYAMHVANPAYDFEMSQCRRFTPFQILSYIQKTSVAGVEINPDVRWITAQPSKLQTHVLQNDCAACALHSTPLVMKKIRRAWVTFEI
jgi:hypothetical protein